MEKEKMKDIIKQLEEKKNALDLQSIKLTRIINELKGIDSQQEKCGDTPTRQHLQRESSEERKVSKKNKSATAGRPNHKPYEKKKGNKWSVEVFDFVRKNLHLKNKEIAEAINKKFKIGTTEGSLGVQMAHQGIKRDKKTKGETMHNSVKKKITPEIEKYIKDHAGEIGDQEIIEGIEEEFDVKVSTWTVKDYRNKNGLPGVGKGRKKGQTYKKGKNKEEDLEMPSEELINEVKNKGKKKVDEKSEFPEIEEFVMKSKTTDPLQMRDKIIEKFEKDIPMAKVKKMISNRLDKEDMEVQEESDLDLEEFE